MSNVKEQRELRMAKGLCRYCKELQLELSQLCETHFLKKVARKHLGSEKDWKALKEKITGQKFTCSYTGDILELGVNASLDHIKSKAKFPELSQDLNNVHWVTKEVNLMKRELTEEQFFELVSKIYNLRVK